MHVAYLFDKENGNINLYLDGAPYSIGDEHLNYAKILERIKTKDYTDIKALVDIPEYIRASAGGKVVVENGKVYWNGEELHNVMVDRILTFIDKGFPIDSLVAFLENLLMNPNPEAVKELYLFLENSNLPLTEDGHFLAYKKVDENYRSYHASPDGTYYDHHLGARPSMDRKKCDDKRNNTCSKGLHFCSLSYLPSYHGNQGRVMVMKINPRDVVTIPSDYSNAKGRVCTYEVLAEYNADDRERKDAFAEPLVDTSKELVAEGVTQVNPDEGYGFKPSGRKYHNVRKGGKFAKRSE